MQTRTLRSSSAAGSRVGYMQPPMGPPVKPEGERFGGEINSPTPLSLRLDRRVYLRVWLALGRA